MDAEEDVAEERKRLAEGYSEIVAGSREFTASQRAEMAALGMSSQAAAKLRYEREMLNDAARQDIALSPAQRAEISKMAEGMAQIETATRNAANAQDELRQAQDFIGQSATDFLSSVVTGSATAEQALQGLLASLAKAALQAALLGDGPLGNLFGGGKGIVGGLVGNLFGFADGGIAANGRPVALPRFAKGGVSRSAAIFGEAGPEAAVPLPDGRRIPVDLRGPDIGRGAGTTNVSTVTVAPSISIRVEGGSKGEDADQKLAGKIGKAVESQMRAIVQQELRQQTRPGGQFSR